MNGEVQRCATFGAWFHYPTDAEFSHSSGWILKIVISINGPGAGAFIVTPLVDSIVCYFANPDTENLINAWMEGDGPTGSLPFDLRQLAATIFSSGLSDDCPGEECESEGQGQADDYAVGCADDALQCCGEDPLSCGATLLCGDGYFHDTETECCKPICGLDSAFCAPIIPCGSTTPPQCGDTVLACDGATPSTTHPVPCTHNERIDPKTGCCRPCCCGVNQVNV